MFPKYCQRLVNNAMQFHQTTNWLRIFCRKLSTKSNDTSKLSWSSERFPANPQRKNLSVPPRAVFIAQEDAAKKINSIIQNYKKPVPFIEMNPGIGLLTKRLINSNKEPLILCEYDKELNGSLQVS